MTESSGITAEEFATWIPTRRALKMVDAHFGNQTGTMDNILGRLKGGLVRAAAHRSSWEVEKEPRRHTDVVKVPADHWIRWTPGRISGDLWGMGDIRVWLGNQRLTTIGGALIVGDTVVRYFGIRFEPSGIDEMIPEQEPAVNQHSVPSLQALTSEEQMPKGPPVSKTHLRDWYAIYTKVFPEAEQTEEHAHRSALGMFLGKSVTRAQIRELRGSGSLKRGRKPSQNKN